MIKSLGTRIYRNLNAISLMFFILFLSSCTTPGHITESGQINCCNTTFTCSEITGYQRALMSDWEKEKNALDGLIKDIPKSEVMPRILSLSKEGNPTALYFLGQMFLGGVGGFPRNEKKAVKFFQLAASKGHAISLDKLAEMYSEVDSQSLKFLVYCYATLASTFGSESARFKALEVEKALVANFPQKIIEEINKVIGEKFSTIILNQEKNLSEIELVTLNDQVEAEHIYKLMLEYLQKDQS